MKYILALILIFFIGCEKNKEKNNIKTYRTNKNFKEINTTKENKIIIKEANLTFVNNKLVFPLTKRVLLFDDNSTFSKMQKDVLNKLKIKYTTVNNKFLIHYFKIKTFPTIIILDKNKTIKYENFVPYEILKAERL